MKSRCSLTSLTLLGMQPLTEFLSGELLFSSLSGSSLHSTLKQVSVVMEVLVSAFYSLILLLAVVIGLHPGSTNQFLQPGKNSPSRRKQKLKD
jgi:NADH:ubiquinone oxidoreductase subunit 5 (subunit L)/multisubunit Na+/H+ antiporter MnhA subunit